MEIQSLHSPLSGNGPGGRVMQDVIAPPAQPTVLTENEAAVSGALPLITLGVRTQ